MEAVRHMRQVNAQVRKVVGMDEDELMTEAKLLGAPMSYYCKLNVKAAYRL